jgi:hypothetical protein
VRRRLFNLLTTLAILLCVAGAAALWFRSYSRNETLGWYRNEWRGPDLQTDVYGLSSDSGGLLVFGLHRRAHFTADDTDSFDECRQINPDCSRPSYLREAPAGYPYMGPEYTGWGSLGFGFYSGQRSPPQRAAPNFAAPTLSSDDRLLVLPYWFLTLAPAAAAAGRLRALRNRRGGSMPEFAPDLPFAAARPAFVAAP